MVCVGIPLEIVDRGESEEERLPTRRKGSKIRVLATLKGSSHEEVNLHYSVLDWEKIEKIVIGGPASVQLEVGRRHRFYLKRSPDGDYFVAATGRPDEGPSVERLRKEETDHSLPVTRRRAVEIARDFVARSSPEIDLTNHTIVSIYYRIFRDDRTPSWRVLFLPPGSELRTDRIRIDAWVTSSGRVDEKRTQFEDLGNHL